MAEAEPRNPALARQAANAGALVRLAACLAAAGLLAALQPAIGFALLVKLLALSRSLAAAVAGDLLWPDHLTRWDEAAVLLAIGLLDDLLPAAA